MSYGLRIFNQNGGIQFDSTKKLFSYIVVTHGTNSSMLVAEDDLVFIKNPSGVSTTDIIFGEYTPATGNYQIKKRATNGVVSNVTCDFFVIGQVYRYPTDGSSHGLVVKNSDGSIQFDSRTMQTNFHYAIPDHVPRKSLHGDPSNAGNTPLTTDTSQYVEIFRSTNYVDYGNGEYDIQGVQYDSNGYPNYIGKSFEVDEFGTITFYFNNDGPFFIGELV